LSTLAIARHKGRGQRGKGREGKGREGEREGRAARGGDGQEGRGRLGRRGRVRGEGRDGKIGFAPHLANSSGSAPVGHVNQIKTMIEIKLTSIQSSIHLHSFLVPTAGCHFTC
jgi:hypothetical protein